MTKEQLQKIIDDYTEENNAINFTLHQLEIKKRALKSRQKIVKRKITILYDKVERCHSHTINWSCNDFDDLDILQ